MARVYKCQVAGSVFDVRPNATAWPFLAGPDRVQCYPQCNVLAQEAKHFGADGLLTPSARHQDGSNRPTFAREPLSNAALLHRLYFSLDAAGNLQTQPV